MNKKVFIILIVTCMLTGLIYTPVESNMQMHIGELDFNLSPLDLYIALTNRIHIIGFGILSLFYLNFLLQDKNKYIKTFIYVFLFSILIEISQIFFIEGHFRLRDMFTNIVGILISFGIFKGLIVNKNALSGMNPVLLNGFAIFIQIIFSCILYFIFKEISIINGGEALREYL